MTTALLPCCVFARAMKHIAIALLIAGTAFAADPDQKVTPPDNTGKNAAKKDLTAENQGGSPEDRELTKKIRSAIVKDDALSTLAKNVKVITINGKVTLRGPVHSEQEKATIGSLAQSNAGKGTVTNQLEVKKNH